MESENFFDTEIIRLTDIPKINKSSLVVNGKKVDYFVSIIDARELKTYSIRDFSWNRDLNRRHVDRIYDDLVNMEVPHLLGTIKIVHNTRYEDYCIFDGQHRKEAIFKRLAENKFDDPDPWTLSITIEVYSIDCEKIEDNETADYLFCMANKVRVFDIKKHSIDAYIQDITKAYQSDLQLSQTINTGVKNVCNKIFLKELFNSLKQYFNPSRKIAVADVIKLIKEKNYQICMLDLEELFPNYKKATPKNQLVMRNKFNRAKRDNFCLNLEDYPHSKWISEIVEKINC
jgi:hypothetical protein